MQTSGARQENWSEHQSTMFSSLHEKQKVGKYCDVVLKCTDSDQLFNAHSCVLSSASHVMDKLLQDAIEKQSKDEAPDGAFPKLVVHLPSDVASSCIDSLLNFIYSGNVDLGFQNESSTEKSEVIRRSTRKTSSLYAKGKSQSETHEESRVDISSLYIFLKAARCLEIKTLTEHLESAATLAKMKMADTAGRRPPKRASAIRFQNTLRSTIIGDLESPEVNQNYEKVKKQIKGRKKKTQSGSNIGNRAKEPRKSPPEYKKEKDSNDADEKKDCTVDYTQAQGSENSDIQTSITQVENVADLKETEVSNENHDTEPSNNEAVEVTGEEIVDDAVAIRNTKSMYNTRRKKRNTKNNSLSDFYPQPCDLCGKLCSSARFKASHMRSHHRPELTCTVCHQTFKYKNALKRHFLWHTGEGQKCNVCKEVFFSQKELSVHMSTHNTRKMRTQCKLCKKWFTSAYVMQLHMRTHNGTELFQCKICSKKFPYKSSLKMHMMLHTGEKPYMCSVCGKSFTQKIHAHEHELHHTGAKRFQCPHCERFFAHKSGLTRHVSDIHFRSRPYVCETCGKSFPRKTKLIEHTRIHTGEKPYICDICGVRYKANRSLKCHKKNRHNVHVPDYEVGIWRKGKPPSPPVLPQQQKRQTTFDFPIQNSSSVVDQFIISDKEEMIINDTAIAKEVDVIATVQASPDVSPSSVNSRDSNPPQFAYPLPQPETNNEQSYSDLSRVNPDSGETALSPVCTPTQGITLPPLSTLSHSSNKTFIVPLNASAASSFSPIGTQSAVPAGMMLTYMQPHVPEPIEIREQTTLPAVATMPEVPSDSLPPEMSRSASVPPMSTFRQHSATSIIQISSADAPLFPQSKATVSLPGMHTFQPVQLPMSVNQIHPQLITRFTVPHGVPVLVPAAQVTASVQMSQGNTTDQIPQIHQRTEWQTLQ